MRRRTVWAGQATLVQNSSRLLPCSLSGWPQDGHSDGATISRSAPVRWDASSTAATNGMTSPARRTSTVSPILMSRARMTSWLASVARAAVGQAQHRAVEVVVELVAGRLDPRDDVLRRGGVVGVAHVGGVEPEGAQG